jgi:hypothetical protein
VLEATPADSFDTLREKFRSLQKRLHPDIAGSLPESVERSGANEVFNSSSWLLACLTRALSIRPSQPK